MTLKHDFIEIVRSGRIIPKILWAVLTDLDDRLTIAEGKEPEDKIAVVAVNVSTGNSTGSSSAAAALVDAVPIGVVPVGNQDQLVDEVVVESDGKVKVTLAAAATDQNQFKVTVLKA